MVTLNKNLVTAYSPLPTPTNFRNNSFSHSNDPYGINPLPNIQSSYVPARDPMASIPNLESWGITGDTSRLASPYLPVYNSLTRDQRGAPRVKKIFVILLFLNKRILLTIFIFSSHMSLFLLSVCQIIINHFLEIILILVI
jgi:hypothetical protein